MSVTEHIFTELAVVSQHLWRCNILNFMKMRSTVQFLIKSHTRTDEWTNVTSHKALFHTCLSALKITKFRKALQLHNQLRHSRSQ
jgi:hypothetical protein